MIIMYNCFEHGTTNILFMKLPEYQAYIKTFATYLNFMPDQVEYEDNTFKNSDLSFDLNIARELQKI